MLRRNPSLRPHRGDTMRWNAGCRSAPLPPSCVMTRMIKDSVATVVVVVVVVRGMEMA